MHLHEALDRCYCAQDIIDRMLLQHAAIMQNREWKAKAQKAEEILAELYMDIGSYSAAI